MLSVTLSLGNFLIFLKILSHFVIVQNQNLLWKIIIDYIAGTDNKSTVSLNACLDHEAGNLPRFVQSNLTLSNESPRLTVVASWFLFRGMLYQGM